MQIKPADSTLWYQNNGDNTLRINYPFLDINSVVVDIGARLGEWCDLISIEYEPKIYCFEIVPKFCRYLRNKGYITFELGIFDKSATWSIGSFDGEASVFYPGDDIQATFIPANDIFETIGEDFIDVMKINVEGAEYEIVENLTTESLNKIKNLQIQFHMIENYEERYDGVSKKLSETHKLDWRYPFIWENWSLK